MSQISTPGAGLQGMMGSLADTKALANQEKQQDFQRQMALKDLEMQGKRMDLQREQTRAQMEMQRQGMQQSQQQFQDRLSFDKQRAQQEAEQQQAEMALRRQEIQQSMQLAQEQMMRADKRSTLEASRSLLLEQARLQAESVERQTNRRFELEARRASMYGAAIADELTGDWSTTMDVFRGAWREAEDRLTTHNQAIETARIAGETSGTDLLTANLIPADANDMVVTGGGLGQMATPFAAAAADVVMELEAQGFSIDEMDPYDLIQSVEARVRNGVTNIAAHEKARAMVLNRPREVAGVGALGTSGGFAEGTIESKATRLALAYIGARISGFDRADTQAMESTYETAFGGRVTVPSDGPVGLDELARAGLRADAPVLTKWLNDQMVAGGFGSEEMTLKNTAATAVLLMSRQDQSGIYGQTIETDAGTTTVGQLVADYLGGDRKALGLMKSVAQRDPQMSQRLGIALNQVQAFLKSAPTSMPADIPDDPASRQLAAAREQFFNLGRTLTKRAGAGQSALGYRDPVELAEEMEILWQEMNELGVDEAGLTRLRNELLPRVLDELEYLSDPKWSMPYEPFAEGPTRGYGAGEVPEMGFVAAGEAPTVESLPEYNSRLEARLMKLLDTMLGKVGEIDRTNRFLEDLQSEQAFAGAEARDAFFADALSAITQESGKGLDADFGAITLDPSKFVVDPTRRFSSP